tara:strand:- start:78 stop:1775 length:1698 start_codon:yes stop_codon:yes gene_type:complete
MALQKYIRQLRPIQENKVDYVERFQVLRENENSEIQAVIKSVEGGKIAEAVYESWAFIVAKTSGSKTLPTIKDVQSAMSKEEFNDKGKKWITDFLSKTEDNTFLLQAIELIGGDMKQIPNVNWGSVQVLHKSIDKYYENTPKKYAEGAKDNTSDMILITKGTVDNLLKALPDSDMSWTDDGRVAIDGTDIEFIQVSLKKGEEEARIGKLSSLINQIYGQQAMRPRQLTMSHSISEEIEQLEEGLRDIFGKAVGLIKLGASKLLDFSKKMFTKLRNSLIKAALKISKTITKDKSHKSSAKLANLMNTNLSENFIVEAKKVLPPVKINAPMMKEMKVLKNEIIKKDLANKEYKEMLKNVAALNSKKAGSIVVINKGTDPILEMNNFKAAADEVLSKKIGDTITRENINPAFKLVVNYASYRTFNTIILDILKNVESYNTITEALVGLNAKLRAEAMFGKTGLPLYIVYGMGGGAQYKHTKNEYEASTKDDIIKLGASMDAPYMYISIAKSETKGSSHNAIYAYVLVGSVKQGDELLPEYLMLQFINRSGKDWSYKIDASKSHTGKLV